MRDTSCFERELACVYETNDRCGTTHLSQSRRPGLGGVGSRHDRIYQYEYRSARSHQETEDLASQVFLKVVRGMDETRGAKTTKRWLIQLTRTTIADYWRARAHLPTSSLEVLLAAGLQGPSGEPSAMSDTATERVQRLLQALPPSDREVLTCRFFAPTLEMSK